MNKKRKVNLIRRQKIHEKQTKPNRVQNKGCFVLFVVDCHVFAVSSSSSSIDALACMTSKIIKQKNLYIQINLTHFILCCFIDTSIDFVEKVQYLFRFHSFVFFYENVMMEIKLNVKLIMLNIMFSTFQGKFESKEKYLSKTVLCHH